MNESFFFSNFKFKKFCINFVQIRRGDRFWYENFFAPTAFTLEQLEEIRKTTLARIICDNSDGIQQIQPNVFTLPDIYG